MNIHDNCPWCLASVPAVNMAGTEFYCPECNQAWRYVAETEEEIGDEEDAPFMGIPLTAAR